MLHCTEIKVQEAWVAIPLQSADFTVWALGLDRGWRGGSGRGGMRTETQTEADETKRRKELRALFTHQFIACDSRTWAQTETLFFK